MGKFAKEGCCHFSGVEELYHFSIYLFERGTREKATLCFVILLRFLGSVKIMFNNARNGLFDHIHNIYLFKFGLPGELKQLVFL